MCRRGKSIHRAFHSLSSQLFEGESSCSMSKHFELGRNRHHELVFPTLRRRIFKNFSSIKYSFPCRSFHIFHYHTLLNQSSRRKRKHESFRAETCVRRKPANIVRTKGKTIWLERGYDAREIPLECLENRSIKS